VLPADEVVWVHPGWARAGVAVNAEFLHKILEHTIKAGASDLPHRRRLPLRIRVRGRLEAESRGRS